ncbi:hypothetical protein EYF80_065433 [Liparis tanakae]|uniref:Uncharacterized protein n=1 Tax=Liparis tanakae TaxID=230148 RepID=A0A4Z2E805_9TELE|nr:hypothetical protein EYF80_065433 [Liparis tanakae]
MAGTRGGETDGSGGEDTTPTLQHRGSGEEDLEDEGFQDGSEMMKIWRLSKEHALFLGGSACSRMCFTACQQTTEEEALSALFVY